MYLEFILNLLKYLKNFEKKKKINYYLSSWNTSKVIIVSERINKNQLENKKTNPISFSFAKQILNKLQFLSTNYTDPSQAGCVVTYGYN